MAFTEYTHSDGRKERIVLRAANPGRSPIIVFHELPGLSAGTMAFGEWLRDEGFDAHLPLLFGKIGQSSNAGFIQMCVSREFAMFRSDRDSKITGWLRSLCHEVAKDAPDGKVGVIGMCATGGLVLSLIWDDSVGAAVAAQPSLPFRSARADIDASELGASVASVDRAVESGKPLLVTAFEDDRFCTAARVQAWEQRFGSDVITTWPGSEHSTLVADTTPEIRATLLEFLTANL
ncbi:MAG: dienelactone hydrolase family protein [Acidimicrobiia bacterium]|nr:dienelactone hydrolase family protein [Acidimicrobiia bacterium]MDH4308242.1 dienelactone hydrolase family protein [Acidimicrobiia bacterium]MDH5292901.1 dienelactone hydrolase family protein [Acidimicrobiia bacterium]